MASLENKASKVGWRVEHTNAGGCIVRGVNADGQPDAWNFDASQVEQAHYLLDYARSVQIGDQYRQERFGLAPGEVDTSPNWVEHKYEIREYREKPAWKRFLGL